MKFKKSKKYIALLLICIIFTIPFCGNASAAEIAPGRTYRWFDVRQRNGTNCAYVQINGDLLQTPFSNYYNSAISHWNSNSGGKAYFAESSFSAANCMLSVPEEDYWLGDAKAGLTFLQNAAGQWHMTYGEGNPFGGSTAYFTSGQIAYAVIYFNPDLESDFFWETGNTISAFHYHYVVRHEMGHVLGMGHPDTVASIMYYNSGDAQYNTIQTYDRNQLSVFYY